ncbi:MAG: AAA family ATPase [Pirellulales bacterium]
MKLKKISIDRFGVWRDLEMRSLDDGLNVVYGPNEVGKSTLMQFVRSMLYGVTGDRRQRFFTATGADAAGGALELTDHGAAHRLLRDFAFAPGAPGHDRVTIDWPDARRTTALATTDEGAAALSRLLRDIDEQTYTAVYAIGIRELQQLACLDDSESARLLYELSTGIQGRPLHEIRHELEATRRQIHAVGDQNSSLARLLDQRRRLSSELSASGQSLSQYYDLCQQRDKLDQEIEALDKRARSLRTELRLIETCLSLREIWEERRKVRLELKSLGDVPDISDEQIARLEQSQHRIRRLRALVDRRAHEMDVARQHVEQLGVSQAFLEAGGQIVALDQQRAWITELKQEVETLDQEIGTLRDRAVAAGAEIPVEFAENSDNSVDVRGALADFDSREVWKALKPLARRWRERRERLTEAREAAEQMRSEAAGADEQVTEAVLARDETDLSEAVERAGNRVSQLRRRVQADERLTQLGQRRDELERETEDSLEHQLLPMWALVVLGSLFVGGAAMILAGTLGSFTELLSFGWSHAGLGVLAVAISGGSMLWMQRAARLRLEDCQKQIDIVTLQMRQADEQREQLDAQLPRGRGPLTVRLQEAERELAELEQLVPVDARRKAMIEEATAAEKHLEMARQQVREIHDEWVAALELHGLPSGSHA